MEQRNIMSHVGRIDELREAARDSNLVDGLTHSFYRYPARFSPQFAAAAIRLYSNPGDLVLDPFMGGGTSVVEGLIAGRRVFGNDINSLSLFVARVKTTPLTGKMAAAVVQWSKETADCMKYRYPADSLVSYLDDERTKNLSLPKARPLKKAVAIALSRLAELPSAKQRDFARCLLLKTSQWALDNRKRATSLSEFRDRLVDNARSMAHQISLLGREFRSHDVRLRNRVLSQSDAAELHQHRYFASGSVADIVVPAHRTQAFICCTIVGKSMAAAKLQRLIGLLIP